MRFLILKKIRNIYVAVIFLCGFPEKISYYKIFSAKKTFQVFSGFGNPKTKTNRTLKGAVQSKFCDLINKKGKNKNEIPNI